MARGILTCALGSLSLLALAGTAQASTITTYSTQASFFAATNNAAGLGFETFEGIDTNGTLVSLGTSELFSSAGFDMTLSAANVAVVSPGVGGTHHSTSKAAFSADGNSPLGLSFSPQINAYGSEILSEISGVATSIVLVDSDNVQHTYSVGTGFSNFFGFTVSGGTVVSMSLDNGSSFDGRAQLEGVDNVYWGFQTIPLPSAATLAMTGIGGLVVTRRRRFTV